MTGAVIDMGAVARARNELAALVAAHPHLTSPEARERLAAALPELTEPLMSNRLDPNAVGASVTVGVRLSPELLAAVDSEAARLGAAAAYRAVGRSDAVRSMLLRCIAADRAREALPAPDAPVSRDIANANVRAGAYRTESQALRAHAPEGPCPTCGGGVSHPCARCGTRTRTCECTVAREGRCASCALAPGETSPVEVDVIVTARRPDAPMVRAQLLALQETDDSSHWTTRAVAERAGVSKNVVNKIMRGENVLPKGLARVAAVLPKTE